MSKITINRYEELRIRISELEQVKISQEAELKKNIQEIYQHFQPKNLIKKTVKDLAHDKELRDDSLSALGNMATDLLVGRIFNKNNSLKGFLKTLLVEKVAVPLLKNNKEKIISFVSDLFSKQKKETEK